MSKITIDRSVVERALEALERNTIRMPVHLDYHFEAIKALRAALEQEKSPQNASSALQASCEVPQVTDQTEHFLVLADEEVYCTKHPQVEQEPGPVARLPLDGRGGYISPKPQVEQEPVAWIFQHDETGWITYVDAQKVKTGFEKGNPRWQKICPVYLNPQPPRQPLTEMEIVNLRQLVPGTLDVQFVKFARAIERAHGITGEQK